MQSTIPKNDFPLLLKTLYDEMETTSQQHLKNVFETCGIYPFSPEKVLDKMPAAKSSSTANLIDKTAVGQAVLTHLKEHRYKQGVNKKIAPKRKKVNISPGRSILFEELSNKDLAPENSSGTLPVPAKKI